MDPEETRARRQKQGGHRLLLGDVAKRALMVMRDDQKLLPRGKDQRILVVEQLIPYEFLGKDLYSHPHMFCEVMTKHSTNLILDDAAFHATDEDVADALNLAKQADLVVVTNYFARIEKKATTSTWSNSSRRPGTRWWL